MHLISESTLPQDCTFLPVPEAPPCYSKRNRSHITYRKQRNLAPWCETLWSYGMRHISVFIWITGYSCHESCVIWIFVIYQVCSNLPANGVIRSRKMRKPAKVVKKHVSIRILSKTNSKPFGKHGQITTLSHTNYICAKPSNGIATPSPAEGGLCEIRRRQAQGDAFSTNFAKFWHGCISAKLMIFCK